MASITRPFRESLATKLGVALVAFAVSLSGLGALLLDREGVKAVDESTVEHLEILAGALEGSFHVFDRDKEVHPVADILAEIGRHPGVDALQVFDHQGRIRHSLKASDRGQVLPPELRNSSAQSVGQGEVAIVRHFAARAACMSCHVDQKDLGGVRMVVDRSRLQAALFELRWKTGITGAAIIGTVLLVMMLLTRRLVTRPMRKLAQLMGHAQEGDFLVRAPVTSQDEMGLLARAFNTMLAAITDLRVAEVERNRESATGAAEARLAGQLEEKNRIIAAKNQELQARLRDLTLLQEVTRSLTSTLSPDEQLSILSKLLSETLGYQEFTLMLVDRPAGLLRVAAAHGFPDEMGIHEMTFAVGEGIAGLVAQTGQMVMVPDTSTDARYLRDRGRFTPRGSLLSLPMMSHGMVMGVLNVFKPHVDAFRQDEAELLQSVASQAALGIANARLFQETLELSLTDALTSMPNRRALDGRLELEVTRAERYGNALSVLMVDVDHFKMYNDRHGHLLGDGVLRAVAQTLAQSVRKADTVARFGGEEFCIILPRQDAKSAREVGEKLRRAVRNRQFDQGETQPGGCITISIGVASYPEDGKDVKSLLDAADEALYAAKHAGRDRVVGASDVRKESADGGKTPESAGPVA
ncbi:MAG: diguanylate cyclase [Myxococcota bacterium]